MEIDRNGLEVLDRDECLRLLAEASLGRVGFTSGALPTVLPVSFRLDGDRVLVRARRGSRLGRALRDAVVAFEVDDYDRVDRSGWSVLVVGRSEVVHDLDVTRKVLAADLEPYADGTRTSIVRIRPVFVSGRRIVREEPKAEPEPTTGAEVDG